VKLGQLLMQPTHTVPRVLSAYALLVILVGVALGRA
jgi:hypothetical protein